MFYIAQLVLAALMLVLGNVPAPPPPAAIVAISMMKATDAHVLALRRLLQIPTLHAQVHKNPLHYY